jgi:diguanylate cyclase (GGDEF)-like protein
MTSLRVTTSHPALAVPLMVAAILSVGAGALALAFALPEPGSTKLNLPWEVVAVLFAASHATALNVQIHREARSVFLSEIPFVLALAFCSIEGLLLGRFLGALVTFVLVRRQYRQPLKLAFNTALALGESAVGIAVFRLVLDGGSPVDGHGWVALMVASIAASSFAGMAVGLVIQLIEDELSPRALLRMLPSNATQATVISTVGVIAAISLDANPASTVILLTTGLGLLVAYRGYSQLSDRHLGLERLYRFTQVVSSSPEMSQVLSGILTQACDLLHAERAYITFLPGTSAESGLEVTLNRAGNIQRGPTTILTAEQHSPAEPALLGTCPVLLPRGSRDPAVRSWLDRRRLRELLAVPLMGDVGVIAVLSVTDRLGEARGFDRSDVRLLETVSHHASTALRNGRLVDQLRHESMHDSLTGLPNRLYLRRALDSRLHQLGPGEHLAVGVLDLDEFKEVNDTLGHARGDELLREVAQRLLSAAGANCLVARLGGDEFAVAFPCKDSASAVAFGHALVESLHQPVLLGDTVAEVGGSLGLAVSADGETDRMTLLKHADIAMYTAKHGAHDVALYQPGSPDLISSSRLALVGELRQAIAAEALDVFVQPTVSLLTGELHGTEALVRWPHPEHGLIGPDEFIPVAERSGLIRPLTALVLMRAISACAEWQPALPGVGISVNLSAKSLTDLQLVDQIDRLLHRYELPPELLTLEITESSIMSDPAKTMALLDVLRSRGIKLSIDDFGTGYSSLSYLRRLPVTEVKIDRSFVTNLEHDDDDAAIARSIIDLARSLSLEVVAEGVETIGAWETLRELGCDTAQGYLLSKPMPIRDLVSWHRNWCAPAPALRLA